MDRSCGVRGLGGRSGALGAGAGLAAVPEFLDAGAEPGAVGDALKIELPPRKDRGAHGPDTDEDLGPGAAGTVLRGLDLEDRVVFDVSPDLRVRVGDGEDFVAPLGSAAGRRNQFGRGRKQRREARGVVLGDGEDHVLRAAGHGLARCFDQPPCDQDRGAQSREGKADCQGAGRALALEVEV